MCFPFVLRWALFLSLLLLRSGVYAYSYDDTTTSTHRYACMDNETFGQRPPPPKAAPPLTPPERRKQLVARSTGVACAAVATSITVRRIKNKLVVVAALMVAYFLGEQAAALIARLFPEAPLPFPDSEPHLHHTSASASASTTTSASTSANRVEGQGSNRKLDIRVEDVERETIQRNPNRKPLHQQLFFWRKERPGPGSHDMDTPAVPGWSDAYKKKQDYEEDYGI